MQGGLLFFSLLVFSTMMNVDMSPSISMLLLHHFQASIFLDHLYSCPPITPQWGHILYQVIKRHKMIGIQGRRRGWQPYQWACCHISHQVLFCKITVRQRSNWSYRSYQRQHRRVSTTYIMLIPSLMLKRFLLKSFQRDFFQRDF